MRKRLLSVILAFCLLLSMLPSVYAAENPVTVTVAGVQDHTQAQEVVELVNQQRTANDLGSLTHNATLNAMAMQRAAEIALYFSHELPDGTSWETYFTSSSYSGYTTCGENIAIGQTSAADVMESWMNSDGHRANILTGEFTQIGVGCFQTNGIYCWVQLFSNSTTDTAVTTKTGTNHVYTDVSILPSRLSLNPSGSDSVTLEKGESTSFMLTSTNPEFSYLCATLVPVKSTCTNGNLVSWDTWYDGTINITAKASGTATMTFLAYDGEASPYTLYVTVEGEEPPVTEPPATEPPVTEPPATEPPATEPPVIEPDKYQICARVDGDGGTMTVSHSYAKAGETVTVKLSPDEGYALDYVDIYRKSDYAGISIEWVNDNTFTFVMPNSHVDLCVYYVQVYQIYVAGDRNIADAYANVSHAREGEHFILTIRPYPGMQVDQIRTYSYGTYAAEGWYLGDFQWEVVMPDGDLEIYATAIIEENPFTDVDEDDYFYAPVLWAVTHRVTAGMDDTHFGPNNTCTRAQVVTFLYRAFGEPPVQSTYNPFKDVKPSDYYYEAVLWAVENGITAGIDATHFGPNAGCTRGQVATFLWRAAGEPRPASSSSPFSDVPRGAYYYDAVLWAVDYGITAGTGNGKFSPNATCTRGQIVTFLYRAMG